MAGAAPRMQGDHRLHVNPLLEVSDFDSSADKPMLLCTLPVADEHARFAVPAVYMSLVSQFDGTKSTDEAIAAFLADHPQYEAAWVRRLLEQSLIPKGLLILPEQDPRNAATRKQSRRAFLYLKLPIIGPGLVDPIASRLAFLFHKVTLSLGLLAFIASHVYVYGFLVDTSKIDFNALNAGSILILMLLSTLGTLCHEFGHASAAAHYGCRRMTIGWGLYIIYTVLWTNVSDAWKLPRQQRAIVDIGGVYFESIFLLLMLALYLQTGNQIFLFAFIFIDLSIATTFNPFLRMDGYWLMSDLFGIVNLRSQQMLWLRGLLSRWFGDGSEASDGGLTPRARRILGLYTILGVFFLGYILTVIYKVVVLNVLWAFPGMVQDLWVDAADGIAITALLGGLLELAWRLLLLFGATVTLYSFAMGGWNLVRQFRAARATLVGRGA